MAASSQLVRTRLSLTVFAVVGSIAFVAPGQVAAATTLEDVSVSPKRIDTWTRARTVKVRLEARSGVPLNNLFVQFFNPKRPTDIPIGTSAFKLRRGSRTNGTWVAKLVIPRYSTAGRWRIEDVYIGRDGLYRRDDLRRLRIRAHFLQVGRADVDPPTLHGFSASPTEFDLSQAPWTVQVSSEITDDLSGAEQMQVEIVGPINLGAWGFHYVDGKQTNGFMVPFGPSPFPVAGTYAINVHLRDRTGNQRHYSSSELAAAGWTSQLTWR
ncbi:MAG TPA: hypothetical protein VHF58_01295 [Solirubrobacterales bacterium]|nr:hypothetical protein [Solirubrobacterales bacterium]